MTRYRTIVADPPWIYPGGFKQSVATSRTERSTPGTLMRREMPFQGMTLEEICALPVGDLADKAGCRCFLWTTNGFLRDAFDVLSAWGFQYGQTLVWHKLNPSPWPTSVAPNSAEFILVGSVGHPGRGDTWPTAVISASVPKGHSRKPECFLDLIEQVSPGPYLELFARRSRLGWHVWGNEVDSHVEMLA